MTARTYREATGITLTRDMLDDDMPDRRILVAIILLGGLMVAATAYKFGHRVSNLQIAQDLVQHECVMVDTLASDRDALLWQCVDGYRTTDPNVMNNL